MEPGESGTRFGTGGARLAATGGTQRDEPIRRSICSNIFLLYSTGTGGTGWDGGTLLRIRRLGSSPGGDRRVIAWPGRLAMKLATIWSPREPTRAYPNSSHSVSSQVRPIQAGASDTVART